MTAVIQLAAPQGRGDVESANRLVDALIERGMTAAIAIVEEIRRRVRALVRQQLPLEEQLLQARRMIARHEPLLARTLTDTLLAAWLTGAKRVVDRLPAIPQHSEAESPAAPVGQAAGVILPPPLPPPFAPGEPAIGEPEPVLRFPIIEEAAKDLAERRLMLRPDFDELAQDARRAAFTVARVGSVDGLEKIQAALVENVQQGGTLREFRERVDEALGGSALSPGHVELVYRTNLAAAYTAGLTEVLHHPLVSDEFPYLLYSAVHDSRARPEHLAMEKHGIGGGPVYRRDDPVIQTFLPPWDFNCRCAIVPLSVDDAARRGVAEAVEWEKTGIPPERPAFVKPPPFEPPSGWSTRPRLEAIV